VLRPGRRIGLLVNPGWFLGLAARTRVGALRHEVLHLLFGHPFRTDLGPVDLVTYGTAADLVVNQYTGRWPLPADARRHPWGSPPIAVSSTLDAGYRLLLAQRFAGETTAFEVWHSDHRYWRAEPGGQNLVPGDVVDAGVGFDGLVGEGVGALGGDALWGLEPGVRSLVLGAVERHRSALDWRRVLRGFAASSRRTEVVHTLARRSRRYGTFPGIRIRRRHRLAVAIDTSGSVSADTLRMLFREVAAIHRGGSEVVVVECDARVQRAWVFTGAPPEEVHGRGGTAFEPVMVWLHGADPGRFDGLVYLTDGDGPPPETRPPCPVLWVLTPEGAEGPHLRFGRSVKIPSEV
jgi:predicted metal-dependent peptidase